VKTKSTFEPPRFDFIRLTTSGHQLIWVFVFDYWDVIIAALGTDATATPASTTGNNQAQSPSDDTAAAATTQPPKKPMRRWRDPLNRSASPASNGCFREIVSTSDNTAFVKFPVMTAVEDATGKAKRNRAN
jgi:hypothetical protein